MLNKLQRKQLVMPKRNSMKQAGFLNLPNDNMVKTIGVALVLCLVCSIVVSGAASLLKPKQLANKELDKRNNIIKVAGIADGTSSTDKLFERIETKVVDFSTGDYTQAVDVASYDQRKASKDPSMNLVLGKGEDIAQVGSRAKYGNVYLVKNGDTVEKIVLPISGYGLWSTLYGFIALESDAQTVSAITFYEHKETPGLGGEIENQKWQKSWNGKKLTNALGVPSIALIKGTVNANTPEPQHKIDGLAGATLTSNGVSNLINFWMGENGFGPYLAKLRADTAQTSEHSLSNLTADRGE